MKKLKLLLFGLLLTLTVNIVHAETITNLIVGTRNDTTKFKSVMDSSFKKVDGSEGLTKDELGNLVYKLALGCKLGESCNYDIAYDGEVTTVGNKSVSDARTEWNAGIVNDQGDVIQPKNRWDENGLKNHGTVSLANGAKNNYTATYRRVGKYGDTLIDVKVSIVDLEEIDADSAYRVSEPAILFRNDQIGVSAIGVKWVTVKFEFLNSETGDPVEVMGNTSYWDIDQNQGVLINDDGSNEQIYYVDHGMKCTKKSPCTEKEVANQLKYAELETGIYIFDQNSGIDPDDSRIYKDNLQSTAYAFTEEFKGTYITRTFQFSDPVLTSFLEGENTWNGHGAIFLSSTSVTEKYKLTTEVVHGTIDPKEGTVTVYEYGDTAIVAYQPESGYELSYIEIDGVKVELGEKIEKNKLQIEMNKDHHVKVVYVIKNSKTGLFEVGGVFFIIVVAFIAYQIVIRKKTINEI